jgi:outer membrane protein assembly factor BamB
MTLCLFVLLVTAARALLESEVGLYDTHVVALGGALQHAAAVSESALALVTARHGVAVLDVATGAVRWQHFAEDFLNFGANNDRNSTRVAAARARLLLTSARVAEVRDAANGAVVYRTSANSENVDDFFTAALARRDDVLLVWTGASLTATSLAAASLGNAVWSVPTALPAHVNRDSVLVAPVRQGDAVLVAATTAANALWFALFDAVSGAVLARPRVLSVPDGRAFPAAHVPLTLVDGTFVRTLDAAGDLLLQLDLTDAAGAQIDIVRRLDAASSQWRAVAAIGGTSPVVLSADDAASVVALSLFGATRDAPSESWRIQRTPLSSFDAAPRRAPVTTAVAFSVGKSALTRDSVRVLVGDADDVIELYDGHGALLWRRHEALAGVRAALFVDLPTHSSHDRKPSNWFERVAWQVQALARLARGVSGAATAAASATAVDAPLVGDTFAFEKLLLLSTEVGRLYAVRSTTGEVVWSRAFAASGSGGARLDIVDVRVLSAATTTSAANGGSAVLGVVARDAASGALYSGTIDAARGATVRGLQATPEVRGAVSLPKGAQWALIDDSGERVAHVHLLGESADAGAAAQLLYHVASGADGVRGLRAAVPAGVKPQQRAFDVEQVWRFAVPPSQRVVARATVAASDRVNQAVRVLQNMTALYKYTDSNRLVLVAEDSAAQALHVYVLDASTGRLAHHSVLADAATPVLVAAVEHALAVTYQNTKHRRFDMLVTELYEHTIDWSRDSKVNDGTKRAAPRVESRTVTLPEPPTALAATQTTHGVAHRQWLLAFESGRVYAVPREFLDVGVDLPEGAALSLSPQLALVGVFVASHTRELGRPAPTLFAVSPTRLESTCVVAATGGAGGAFLWRALPSGRFDVLAENFGYLSLIGTIGATVLATLVVRHLADGKALKEQWQ